MVRRELVPAKQEKAFMRVKNFRKEIQEYKTRFEKLKSDRAEAVGLPPPPPHQLEEVPGSY